MVVYIGISVDCQCRDISNMLENNVNYRSVIIVVHESDICNWKKYTKFEVKTLVEMYKQACSRGKCAVTEEITK